MATETRGRVLFGFALAAILGLAFLPKLLNGKGGVELLSGWNMVAYMGKTQPIEAAMAPIEAYVETVWQYVGGDVEWVSWAPVWGGALVTAVHGEAYWVDVIEDCYWSW